MKKTGTDSLNTMSFPCGGMGMCGKCRVRFGSNAPLPNFSDRRHLTPEELRDGIRLGCQHKEDISAADDVTCIGMSKPKRETRTLTKTVSESYAPGHGFIAVDLGTTTVVLRYITAEGKPALEKHFLNPQRRFGTDVISRMEAALRYGSAVLREELWSKLEQCISQLCLYGKPEFIVFSGNTTMEHLLLGYSVETLSKAPFEPAHRGFSNFEISGIPAVFLPGLSAFVGADILSGITALGLHRKSELSLFIDLGTNGELVMGNCDRMVAAATAAGSVFEGSITASAPGTDITACIYELVCQGIIDSTGLLQDKYFESGYDTGSFVLTQSDIRAFQLAKGAICAGVKVLTEEFGCLPDKVYLAGGFGCALDINSAIGTGLLPAGLSDCCTAVGNTSLEGACRYGAEPEKSSLEMLAVIEKTGIINLAEMKGFEDSFVSSMELAQIY